MIVYESKIRVDSWTVLTSYIVSVILVPVKKFSVHKIIYIKLFTKHTMLSKQFRDIALSQWSKIWGEYFESIESKKILALLSSWPAHVITVTKAKMPHPGPELCFLPGRITVLSPQGPGYYFQCPYMHIGPRRSTSTRSMEIQWSCWLPKPFESHEWVTGKVTNNNTN